MVVFLGVLFFVLVVVGVLVAYGARRGRGVAPNVPCTIAKSEDERWMVLKKRMILAAPIIYCVFMLLDWMRIARAGLLYNWDVALLSAGVNIIWTVFLIGASLFLLKKSLSKRINSAHKGANPRDGTDRIEGVDRDIHPRINKGT